ncbi:hypothetical protein QFC19_004134 [Naganishia cerealis]|uniref:Uncharacterized protein n=1 Tax=Naganishia cerealis TaxID=610337 RepID=A0ACC2VYF8_9TREE|nr:hypothetical protein QFC19_004134 [Naganishia cerealis]
MLTRPLSLKLPTNTSSQALNHLFAAIDSDSVHRIHSGQVVLGLDGAVKELVENSIDAGATVIEVKIKDNGLESIEVVDNGAGIREADWQSTALKHHTSKITSFDDLSRVDTFGFRGEALSALCALSQSVTICTSTQETQPLGRILKFGRDGQLKDSNGKIARQSDGKGSLRSAVTAVWGVGALESLIDVDIELEVEIDKAMAKREGIEVSSQTVRATGLISATAFGSGRTSSDRQYYYINGRPFVATKIARAINELYKSYNTNQFPFVILDLQIPPDAVDVNVSPDKREIFVHSENNLIEALRSGLEQLFEPSRSTYLEQNIQTPPRPALTGKSTHDQPLFLADDNQEDPRQGDAAQALDIAPLVDRATSTSSRQQRGPQRPPATAIPTRARARSPFSVSSASHRLAPRSVSLLGLDSPAGTTPQETTVNRSLPATHFSPTPKAALEYEEGENEDDGFSQDEEVRLVLDASRSDPPATSNQPTRRLLQTTLNNVITRSTVADASAIPNGGSGESNISSRARLRGQIAGFASQGAVIELDRIDSGSDLDSRSEVINIERESVMFSELDSREDADSPPSEDVVEVQNAPLAQVSVPHHPSPSSKGATELDDMVMETPESTAQLMDDTSPHVINNNQYILREKDEDITYLADMTATHEENEDERSFRNEILKASPQGEITIRCDINRIRARAAKRRKIAEVEAINKKRKLDENDMLPNAGIANSDSAQVDRVLSRVIGKEDFNEMIILGQYNLAFIIARRIKASADGQSVDDIFIIDQHASDEKYNFETLQATTRIRSQTLIQPKPLQLPSADEITAMENLDILAKNGFGVSVDEDAPYGKGQRIRLTSMPVSKETVFDVKGS